MELLRITHDRVWVAGYRLHHGLVGTVGLLISAVLVWTDRHDFPFLSDT